MKIERLVVENLTWLKRKAHQYYSDDFDADDLASETIEKILRSKDKFDSRKSFRP
ncbi:sigma factor [Muribaculum intestinale]|uniref:sigma factor n=2 Tax=Muribaculaceae TaxID=2005473 RepID=UPI0034E477E9